MNRTPRLSKSGVEYLDYSWGIFSGCQNLSRGICPVKVCWAKGIATHYPKLYPDGFEPYYYPEAIDSPIHLKKPSIISVGWVGEVIGYGNEYRDQIFQTIQNCPQHRFLFLTKNPGQLSAWGNFPENAWVGVTATDYGSFVDACGYLGSLKHEGKIKTSFLSIEPLLSWDSTDKGSFILDWLMMGDVDQVIIGQQTPIRPETTPKIEHIKEIVEACDKADISVFLKNNLRDLLVPDALMDDIFWADHTAKLRQELP